jgi:hypothetical protein
MHGAKEEKKAESYERGQYRNVKIFIYPSKHKNQQRGYKQIFQKQPD